MRLLSTIFLPAIRLFHGKRKKDIDVSIMGKGDILQIWRM